MRDGKNLLKLLEVLSGERLVSFTSSGTVEIERRVPLNLEKAMWHATFDIDCIISGS